MDGNHIEITVDIVVKALSRNHIINPFEVTFRDFEIDVSENGFTVIGREYDNVLIPIDERIHYNEDARLIAETNEYYPYIEIKNLFEGITRVKQNLLFVVINNPDMFKIIQKIITWYEDTKR